ncbi:MAG: SDR family NAD(P)-dependent oxidoreductase [bacterium]
MSKRFEDQVVWITGGGSGLGREMALEFARRGAHVAVSGRRKDRLEETVKMIEEIGRQAAAVVCDVTDEPSVEAAVESVLQKFGRLDVVVANAGFSVAGRIQDLSADDWRRQFDTNVVGLAVTAKHSIEPLKKTSGRLVLIGSVAGMVASPGVGAYHASKYAARAIGQVLAMELEGTGVTCTTIQPGFVKSEIAQVDNDGEFHPEWEDKRPQPLMWETDKAAKTIVDAVAARKREFTFTAHGKAAGFLGKHAPGLVHFAVTRFVGGYKRR